MNKIKQIIRRLFKPSIKPEFEDILNKMQKHGWHGFVVCDEGERTFAGLYGKNSVIAEAIKNAMIEHPLIRDAVIRATADFICDQNEKKKFKSELEDLGITTNEN